MIDQELNQRINDLNIINRLKSMNLYDKDATGLDDKINTQIIVEIVQYVREREFDNINTFDLINDAFYELGIQNLNDENDIIINIIDELI